MPKDVVAAALAQQVVDAGLPAPTPEFLFHPFRKWRADLAWVEHRLLLEVDGGNFVRGAHSTGDGLRRQYAKQNAAILLGYRVLRVLPEQVKSGYAVTLVRAALDLQGGDALFVLPRAERKKSGRTSGLVRRVKA